MLFGVYLLIRKRAVLRYIWRPPQGKGQATGRVFYHKLVQKSRKNGQKSTFFGYYELSEESKSQ